jgi:hypothetical protein
MSASRRAVALRGHDARAADHFSPDEISARDIGAKWRFCPGPLPPNRCAHPDKPRNGTPASHLPQQHAETSTRVPFDIGLKANSTNAQAMRERIAE